MSIDVATRLAALTPAPTLAAAERRTMLSAILAVDPRIADRPSWSPRRRRLVVGGAVAALAVASAIVVPVVVPSSTPVLGHASPAAAAELRRLAVIVGHHRPAALGPHQYLYIAEDGTQRGLLGVKGTAGSSSGAWVRGTRSTHRESWTSRTGRLWRRDGSTDPVAGPRVDDYVIPPDEVDSPAHFASLPTDSAKLDHYLRHGSGYGGPSDRDVFDQIVSILQTGIAPSAVRAAALDLLAETDHVTVVKHDRDSRGRRAERFVLTYHAQGKTLHESIFLDPDDGRVLETASHGAGVSYVDTVTAERVVNSVPASVRRGAAHHK